MIRYQNEEINGKFKTKDELNNPNNSFPCYFDELIIERQKFMDRTLYETFIHESKNLKPV